MGFWQNVEEIREYKCISRKELALRISKVLDTPLEELLAEKKTKIDMNEFIHRQKLFSTYMPLIQKIDKLPENAKKALITIINMM